MIDLHTHILPGIDDGPRDLSGSLSMAEVARSNGIRTLVATPHVREDFPGVAPEAIAAMARDVHNAFAHYEIGIRVVPGAELAITRAVDMDDDELRVVTLAGNGRDILLETPHGPLPSLFETVARDLQKRGFRVTLAHPELSRDLQANPRLLRRLTAHGALIQVTASSLAERWSRRGRFARRLVKDGLVHVVASDSHSADWRPPDLGPAETLGPRLCRYVTETVPGAILAGVDLPAPPR